MDLMEQVKIIDNNVIRTKMYYILELLISEKMMKEQEHIIYSYVMIFDECGKIIKRDLNVRWLIKVYQMYITSLSKMLIKN